MLVLHKPDVVSLITHRAYGAAKNIASKKNSLEEFLIEGEWEKSSQTFLVNNAKLVNPTVKPQAYGQTYFSVALK